MPLRTFGLFLERGSLEDVGIWIIEGGGCWVKADTLPLCNGAPFQYRIP